MSLWHMLWRELGHDRKRTALAVLSVALAAGFLAAAVVVLNAYELQARRALAQQQAATEASADALQEEMRKATLKLSFNLLILPENQDIREWHTQGFSTNTMPEEYVTRLANSDLALIQHLLPILQQKVLWPERNRTILLVGTRGEVPALHGNQQKPLLQPVPPGSIVLGHELHRSLGIARGERVQLMGREFSVTACYDERGSRDDITAWINLADAQQLLNKPKQLNAILALECLCADGEALPRIREALARILPGTQVLESSTKALARAEARTKIQERAQALLDQDEADRAVQRAQREKIAMALIALVLPACAAWVIYLGFANVRQRRAEIAILRTLGYRAPGLFMLFLARSLFAGAVGGPAGLAAGLLAGRWLGGRIDPAVGPLAGLVAHTPWLPGMTLLVAVGLTVASGWLAALYALQQDPADILREA